MRVNFEIPAYLHDALKRRAEAQGRSISDILRQQVVEFVERDCDRMDKIISDYAKNGPSKPIVVYKKESADD